MAIIAHPRALFKRDRSASIYKLTNEHARVNLEIARRFLANVESHGGNESLPVTWARLVVAKAVITGAGMRGTLFSSNVGGTR